MSAHAVHARILAGGARLGGVGVRSASRAAALLLLCLGWAGGAGANPSFTGLGDLPGGGSHSHARDVSADGSTVVAGSVSASGQDAFVRKVNRGGLGGAQGGFHGALEGR